MEIHLTADQEAFIREGIASGRFQNPEDAVQEALILWEERERRRAEILASIDKAEASLAAGKGRAITAKSVKILADTIKKRGRAQLAGNRSH